MRTLDAAVGMVVAVLAVGSGTVRAQGEAEAAAAFDEAYETFARVQRGRPAAVTGLYAEDAFYLAPGDSIERGDVGVTSRGCRSSRREGAGGRFRDHRPDGERRSGHRHRLLQDPPGGEPGSGSDGKFIVIWKRDPSGACRSTPTGTARWCRTRRASERERVRDRVRGALGRAVRVAVSVGPQVEAARRRPGGSSGTCTRDGRTRSNVKWRRGRDSNPRDAVNVYAFQSRSFDHSDTSPQKTRI